MGHNFMCLLQLTATQQQQFDDACAAVTTQSPATTDDDTTNDACLAALGRLANAPANCTPTSENDVDTVCSGECRGLYEDVAANCASDVSFVIV